MGTFRVVWVVRWVRRDRWLRGDGDCDPPDGWGALGAHTGVGGHEMILSLRDGGEVTLRVAIVGVGVARVVRPHNGLVVGAGRVPALVRTGPGQVNMNDGADGDRGRGARIGVGQRDLGP